jgi:hypothetical protein
MNWLDIGLSTTALTGRDPCLSFNQSACAVVAALKMSATFLKFIQSHKKHSINHDQ